MSRFGRARIGGIGIAVGAALMLASPALACMPLPYPPMPAPAAGASAADVAALGLAWSRSNAASRAIEDRDWQLKQQGNLFDMAKSLVIVRYDREATVGKGDDAEKAAVLKPVRWVKGEAPSKVASELQLGTSQPPPCGRMRGDAALNGKPGDVFLVYLSGNAFREADLIEAYAIDRIIEPRTLAALNAQ